MIFHQKAPFHHNGNAMKRQAARPCRMSPYRTARTSARWAAPRSCAACAGPRRAASCTRGQRSFPAQKWTSPGKKSGDFTMV